MIFLPLPLVCIVECLSAVNRAHARVVECPGGSPEVREKLPAERGVINLKNAAAARLRRAALHEA